MVTAATTIEEIEAETKLLSHCTTIDEAKVDRVHEIASSATIIDRKKAAYNHYKKANMPHKDILSHMKGINFEHPVEERILPCGTELQQWQVAGRQGNYYSNKGELPGRLGINPSVRLKDGNELVQREKKIYIAKEDVSALTSKASEIEDFWSDPGSPYFAKGGGTQYHILENEKLLETDNG